MVIIQTVFIFLSIAIVTYILLSLFLIKEKSTDRIKKYFEVEKAIDELHNNQSKIKIHPRKFLNELGKKMSNVSSIKSYTQRLQNELIRAGIPLKGEEFLAIQVLIVFVVVLLFLNWSQSFVAIALVVLLGLIISRQIIKIKKMKRYKQFNNQLGDAIILISNSLKAGYSLIQAIDSVAREMPEPISKEFTKMLKEMKLGVSTEEALNNLLRRVESDDLELMIIAVLIQREIGGNLSEILDNISNTIRERVRIKGEVRTLTAQGRMSGIVVSLLPIVLGAVLYVINPDYMAGLFKSTIGIIIIVVAFVNQLIGIIVINKIVKIEV